MSPASKVFKGTLGKTGNTSTLTTVGGNICILMSDPQATGVYSRNGVLTASQHFAGLNSGSPISVSGFVQKDDIDGTGDMQNVLHYQRDLTQ